MVRFLVGRVLGLIPTVFVIITLSLFIIRLAPGSPFSSEKALSPEVLKDLREKYGFDKSLGAQYVHYFSNLLRGDLGLSTKYPQRTVNEIIADGFPVTLTLAAVALVWALLIGITAGIVGAVRHNTVWDRATMAVAIPANSSCAPVVHHDGAFKTSRGVEAMRALGVLDAIENDTTPPVTGEDGRRALALAVGVLEKIDEHVRRLSSKKALP